MRWGRIILGGHPVATQGGHRNMVGLIKLKLQLL
jgi:hypothetical protein